MNLLTKTSFRKEGNVYTHTDKYIYILFVLVWGFQSCILGSIMAD